LTAFGRPTVAAEGFPAPKPIVNSGLKDAWFRLTATANPMRPGGNMKLSTKDQVQGKLHELKGKLKQKAGQVANNPNLAAQGQDEKLAGKIQKKVGQIEKVFEK
jgi:uncharacterized protein YjbJ (UPF0337 family)